MTLYNIKGRLVKKNVFPYIIDWNGKSKSIIQFQTKQFLKRYWFAHVCYEEFPVYGSRLQVDLLNATLKIAIEVNGPQHNEFHYFHNKRPYNFLKGIKNDMSKLEWLEKNEFKLVEINFDEVLLLSQEFFAEKYDIIL